jgi:hypothetical protein
MQQVPEQEQQQVPEQERTVQIHVVSGSNSHNI